MKNQKKPAIKSAVKKIPIEDIPVEEPQVINNLADLKEPGVSVSEGIGDTISKITGALGITECAACIKRKEILNRQFSYLQMTRDVTEDEVLFMERLNLRPGYIADADIRPLFALYNSLFNKNLGACRCGGSIAQIMRIINSSFKYHQDNDNN